MAPGSCEAAREDGFKALTEARTERALSVNIPLVSQVTGTSACRCRAVRQEATLGAPPLRGASGFRAIRDAGRKGGELTFACGREDCRPHREVERPSSMMNKRGELQQKRTGKN